MVQRSNGDLTTRWAISFGAARFCASRFYTLSSFAALMVGLLAGAVNAEGYTTKSKEVKAMVDKGVAFLTAAGPGDMGHSAEMGGTILCGYAVFKASNDSTNPMVQAAISEAIALVGALDNERFMAATDKRVYEVCMAGILLASVDVDQFRTQAEAVRDFLVDIVRPYGGWGYIHGPLNRDTGDTSQTQYALLCLWTLDQLDVPVPAEPVEKSLQWLVRTQDIGGGWGYQGKLYASNAGKQDNVSHALTAAGMCAVLMAGDFLGFYRNRLAPEEEDWVPNVFVRVTEDNPRKKKKITLQSGVSEPTIEKGLRWQASNAYSRERTPNWYYYYMYSVERYEAFLEIRRKKQEKSPKWYNDGVAELMSNQAENGAWGVIDHHFQEDSEKVCTALAILFLIRSTQKAIGEVQSASIVGIGSLPQDLSNIDLEGGMVIDKSQKTAADDILGMLEGSGATELNEKVVRLKMKLSENPEVRNSQLSRLERVLQSSQDYEARRIAAVLLGRGDDLDFVPSLIFGLSDPDPVVPVKAEASLRVLSRRLDQVIIPTEETPNDQHRAKAIKYWKEWYLSVRPDFVFVE